MSATLLDSNAIEPAIVRQALGHFATGVTVVTTRGQGGEPVGTTASAVSSLSLTPPLLLVCLERSSETLASIRDHRAFAVNVLAESQAMLSANFARRGAEASWEEIGYQHGATGCPCLDGVLTVLHCRLERCLDGGDHEIVIGGLVGVDHNIEQLGPLLHFRGSYASLGAE